MSEDGGKTWRRVETFPGVPNGSYVTDVFASPRDVNVVFVTLNNWQRGDFKPYLLKSVDRGRTFTSIAGNLPDRHPVWAIVQDHVNGDLLFAGTEFALFFSPDGGTRWVQLRGGLPTAQIRDMDIQKRETDLVLGTFGRSFYVLDDYSALREVTAATLGEEAKLFPLRHAYQYSQLGQLSRDAATTGPPTIRRTARCSRITCATRMARTRRWPIRITDAQGRPVRRMNVRQEAGSAAGRVEPDGRSGSTAAGRRAAGRTWRSAQPVEAEAAAVVARGGGGGPQGPAVQPGRYFAQLVKITGGTETPIGTQQSFAVVALPEKD